MVKDGPIVEPHRTSLPHSGGQRRANFEALDDGIALTVVVKEGPIVEPQRTSLPHSWGQRRASYEALDDGIALAVGG